MCDFGKNKKGSFKGNPRTQVKVMPKEGSTRGSSRSGASHERKARKEKDPNAPKRPKSGYFLFLDDVRASIKEENPDFKVSDVAKEAGRRWNELSESKKKPYLDKAEQLKKEYEEELAKYQGE